MADPTDSCYSEFFLMVEPGENPFHEFVHFWHHVGTTEGAFRLLSHHIESKAINRVIRQLWRKRLLCLPLSESALHQIPAADARLIQELKRAMKYRRLFRAYARDPEMSHDIPSPAGTWYAGPKEATPFFLVNQRLGFPVSAGILSELHNLILARLQGHIPLAGQEQFLLDRILAALRNDNLVQAAYLCDWALMVPNPNIIHVSRAEIHPGWRLFCAIDCLDKLTSAQKDDLTSYAQFTEYLSHCTGFLPPTVVLDHFQSFIDLAEHGASETQKDARRNRQFYRAVSRLLGETYSLRRSDPSIFALPHLHESHLMSRLLPLAVRLNSTLSFPKEETSDWYFDYLFNVSLSQQALSESRLQLQCYHRYLGFDLSRTCAEFRRSLSDESRCYAVPEADIHKEWIPCEFHRFFQDLAGGKSDASNRS